jgi:GH18 family chitinase
VSPENNGLYQSAETANDISSWKIAEEMQSGKFIYDNQAKASHLWNAEDRVFLSLMKHQKK